jgi:hypothetical protein
MISFFFLRIGYRGQFCTTFAFAFDPFHKLTVLNLLPTYCLFSLVFFIRHFFDSFFNLHLLNLNSFFKFSSHPFHSRIWKYFSINHLSFLFWLSHPKLMRLFIFLHFGYKFFSLCQFDFIFLLLLFLNVNYDTFCSMILALIWLKFYSIFCRLSSTLVYGGETCLLFLLISIAPFSI